MIKEERKNNTYKYICTQQHIYPQNITHKKNLRIFLEKFRQLLRIFLTNFIWKIVYMTDGASLQIPSRTFAKKLHKISKEMDDNRTITTRIVYISYRKIRYYHTNYIGVAYEITLNI